MYQCANPAVLDQSIPNGIKSRSTYLSSTFLCVACLFGFLGCAMVSTPLVYTSYEARPPKRADYIAPNVHPEKLAEVRDKVTIIGSVTITKSSGSPDQVIEKLRQYAQQYGADLFTVDDAKGYDVNTGIYIPPTTSYVPTTVQTQGNITVNSPYGGYPVPYANYTSTQTQYVPRTNPGIDTRRVVHIPTLVARFYALKKPVQ